MPARSIVRLARSLAVALALAPLIASAQQPRQQRAPSGAAAVPDITGSWERLVGGRGQQSPLVPPPAVAAPQLKPPYLAEQRARQQAAREADAKGQPLATHNVYCLPDGMPAMMGAVFPLEILQSRGQITMIEEAYTQVRRILLDRPQKALEDVEPGYYGHSVGRWEGDTLVVDTIGIKENVRYQNMPHSPQMRIRERIQLKSPDVLWDQITIEDPVTLEQPYTYTIALRRMADYQLLEYVCEDNREYADENGIQRIRVGGK